LLKLNRRDFRALVSFVLALPLAGCGALFGAGPNTSVGQTGAAPSNFGYAVADEPQAALVAQQILNQGGNAADAAAAAGFALAVTLPSRAGLGGGGACVIHVPDAASNQRPAVALLFPPGPPAGGGDRPAAVPAMARGLLAMEARFGVMNFASVIVPAERLAGGVPVSPALASDLAIVGNALLANPAADEVFAGPDGRILTAGATLSQPDLATTLEILRTQGVTGFYAGGFAAALATSADAAGGGLTAADIAAVTPVLSAPALDNANGTQVAFIPSVAPVAAAMPATAGFAVLDKNGGTVACAVTMNNLFGTGRIAAGTGILLGASPRGVPPPVLGGAVAYAADNGNFRAAVTGTGQQGAAVAVAQGMIAALRNQPAVVPEPGRTNVISCPGGVPGGEASCVATADPRGLGLAVGGR
jgi:gamma-glutamyltranspeptidase/glutathione hydrolase